MFKLFTLILILTTLAALEAQRSFTEADNKCQDKFDVTSKEIEDLYPILSHGTDAIDRKFKCFSKCLMDELHFFDENGKLDFKRIVDKDSNHRGDPHAVQVVADCEAKHDLEADECERTFKIFACMTLALNKKPQHIRH